MRRRAFTLIELLVVIAIIAILAAILFPVFAQAKAAAKTTVMLSNQKQIATATQMYSSDFDDMTVPGGDPWWSDPALPTWEILIYPYVKNQQIFWDPSIGTPGGIVGLVPGIATDLDVMNDWAAYTHIMCNFLGYSYSRANNYGTRSLTAIKQPSQRVAYAVGLYDNGPWGVWHFNLEYVYNVTQDPANEQEFWAGALLRDARKHQDNYIIAYADGHAGKVNYKRYSWPRNDEETKEFWGNPYDVN